MLEALLRLVDYATKLLESRSVQTEKFFDRVVTPAYEASEKILQNYLEIFQELRVRVNRGDSREELAAFVERGRIDFMPARIKLRALVQSEGLWMGEIDHRFVAGVVGLLCGGLSTYEEHQLTYHYTHDRHTLLDILYRFNSTPERQLAHMALHYIGLQESAVRGAWADLSAAYTEMLTEVVKSGYVNLAQRVRREAPRDDY
jgi:hypothetical protein